jgi:hypothetical protein
VSTINFNENTVLVKGISAKTNEEATWSSTVPSGQEKLMIEILKLKNKAIIEYRYEPKKMDPLKAKARTHVLKKMVREQMTALAKHSEEKTKEMMKGQSINGTWFSGQDAMILGLVEEDADEYPMDLSTIKEKVPKVCEGLLHHQTIQDCNTTNLNILTGIAIKCFDQVVKKEKKLSFANLRRFDNCWIVRQTEIMNCGAMAYFNAMAVAHAVHKWTEEMPNEDPPQNDEELMKSLTSYAWKKRHKTKSVKSFIEEAQEKYKGSDLGEYKFDCSLYQSVASAST